MRNEEYRASTPQWLETFEEHRAAASRCFLEVRRALNKPETRMAYNRCFKKPWRFYVNHTVDEAVSILIDECNLR